MPADRTLNDFVKIFIKNITKTIGCDDLKKLAQSLLYNCQVN